jgi:hypothetical protein
MRQSTTAGRSSARSAERVRSRRAVLASARWRRFRASEVSRSTIGKPFMAATDESGVGCRSDYDRFGPARPLATAANNAADPDDRPG